MWGQASAFLTSSPRGLPAGAGGLGARPGLPGPQESLTHWMMAADSRKDVEEGQGAGREPENRGPAQQAPA